MSDMSAFGGASLLDLFKLEAESHGAALSSGLLAWEKTPTDQALIEPLMRAAHSIKGAARIVGLDVIVPLAHAMEDCFVAAREGREPLTPARVDQLLKCIDVLEEVRTVAENTLPAWISAKSAPIATLVEQLRAPAPAPAPKAVPQPPAPAPASVGPRSLAAAGDGQAGADGPREATPHQSPGAPASHLRVAPDVMNRMLFLAGESTVEASRLQSLRAMLAGLKARERSLEEAVQSVGQVIGRRSWSADAAADASYGALMTATGAMHSALAEQATRLDESLRRVEELSGALYTEVVRSRMRPFSEGISGFPRMVRDISRELGKEVTLGVEGDAVHVDRDILQKLESPLTHLIRNSLDHGLEPPSEREAAGKPRVGAITLRARHQGGMLVIEVGDDGRGIDPEAVRRKVVERRMVDEATAARLSRAELMEMLFLPGFSTKTEVTQISGRGVGLDVVQSMAQAVSGTVTLESEYGRGAKFTMRLPVTRSVVRAVIVRIGGELFAVPLARLDRVVVVAEDRRAARTGTRADQSGRLVGRAGVGDQYAGDGDTREHVLARDPGGRRRRRTLRARRRRDLCGGGSGGASARSAPGRGPPPRRGRDPLRRRTGAGDRCRRCVEVGPGGSSRRQAAWARAVARDREGERPASHPCSG
jgi:two-component system sensor histidine kinase and response regulator WspE